MPVQLYAPGVYVEEVPSSVRTVVGVSTSVTAFLGTARRGPTNVATAINSQGEFDRTFGGLFATSEMSYAVQHFFQNGGSRAVIVRVHNGALRSGVWLNFDGTPVRFVAQNEGLWGDALRLTFTLSGGTYTAGETFDLTISAATADGRVEPLETYFGVTLDATSAQYLGAVLEQSSAQLRIDANPGVAPGGIAAVSTAVVPLTGGSDGSPPDIDRYDGTQAGTGHPGFTALDAVETFNLLCAPFPLTATVISDADRVAFWALALPYCARRRAFAVIDPPVGWTAFSDVDSDLNNGAGLMSGLRSAFGKENGGLYFPRVVGTDALAENRLRTFQPCGMVAGVMARTDAARGVWKAPAGVEATLGGSLDLDVQLTDVQQGRLNDEGINALRAFPGYGRVVWGSRTLDGQNRAASQWKYVPVRRFASFLEESLWRGTRWSVFEPNDAPLWAQLRLNIGAFMQGLFRQGAFAGTSAKDAYFVLCDATTTTQADIDLGVVNVVVGYAPLRPAEFVILRIQQIASSGGV
jgi:hypothetical protein